MFSFPAIVQRLLRSEATTSTCNGVAVDCGSGHTSIVFYQYTTAKDGERESQLVQQRKTWLKHWDGGNLPITDIIPGWLSVPLLLSPRQSPALLQQHIRFFSCHNVKT